MPCSLADQCIHRKDFSFDEGRSKLVHRPSGVAVTGVGISEIVNQHGRKAFLESVRRKRRSLGWQIADELHREASKKGNELHKWLEEYFELRDKGLNPPPTPAMRSLQPFLERIKQPLLQEFLLTGEILPGYQVYGFADILFEEIDGSIAIADWKSSWEEKKQIARPCLQVAAYAYLVWTNFKIRVDRAYIPVALHTGKPAQVLQLDRDELANWIEAFAGLLGQYHSL